MSDAAKPGRSAILAGATGLVGRALLRRLVDGNDYTKLHLLLRRAAAELDAPPKVETHVIDFGQLPSPLPAVDDVYIALGTTLKTAGSEAAFRRVDFDYVVNVARAGRRAGASRLGVVSALGADAKSRVFYNRVKGEMEAEIAKLGYEVVLIAQPSLLMGDRNRLGQPVRLGEVWAQRLLGPISALIPAGLRPIGADQVAKALLEGLLSSPPGCRVILSRQMQGR